MNPQLLQQGEIQDLDQELVRERKSLLIQAFLVLLMIAALTLFLLVLGGHSQQLPPSSFKPYSDGFLGLYRTLRELGEDVRRNRNSFEMFFSNLGRPEEDSLLLLAPKVSDLSKLQTRSLVSWIEKGGRLLLADGLFTPTSIKGISFYKKSEAPVANRVFTEVPKRAWAPLGGRFRGSGPLRRWAFSLLEKEGLEAKLSPFVIRSWELDASSLTPADLLKATRKQVWGIPVFGRPDESWTVLCTYRKQPVILERSLGKGKVILCSTPLLFSNLACGGLGSGPLAIHTILRISDGGRRRAIIDEWSHGFRLAKGFFHFLRSERLFYPALGLLLLYLTLLWRGAIRPGPLSPSREVPRRSKEEYILAQGRLLDQSGDYKAAALWLFQGYDQMLQRETGTKDWPRREELLMDLKKVTTGDRNAFQAFGHRLSEAFRSLASSKSKE